MEFPIFSFFISLLSLMDGNETTTRNRVLLPRAVAFAQKITQSTTTTMITPIIPDIRSLCPEQTNSADLTLLFKSRYFNKTKKCYTVLSQGPCGNNMAYFAKDDILGECGCKPDNRLLIYNKGQDKCFHIFQQSYCDLKSQWLDLTPQGRPICTRNPCFQWLRINKKDMVQLNGKCVEVGKPALGCDTGQVVGFLPGKRLPTCVSNRTLPVSPRAIGIPSTPCDFGSLRALDGRCHMTFDFD